MKQATPEIRSIVVAAYSAGTASRKQLVDILGYHVETISRWTRCSREGRLVLFTATGTALNTITASDAKGWFESCGYTAFKS